VDAVGNNNGCITRCKLIWTSWRCVFRNVRKISRVGSKPLADPAVSLATLAEVGRCEPAVRIGNRAAARSLQRNVGMRNVELDQRVVTPLALSQGCGLIAW
jgi:hypothetical protein